MELGTAKGKKSEPPSTEPLLNTDTIFTFTELLRKTALQRAP